jgi:putative oxidoreductase
MKTFRLWPRSRITKSEVLRIQSGDTGEYMKIASLIARLLLGVIFAVFGLNGFLHFINGPLPTGPAGQFVSAIFASKYWVVIFGVQFISGVLFLVNRFVPLALVLIGPVIVNILCFHALFGVPGLPMAIVVALLWAILAIRNKQHLAGIFVQRT